MGKNQWVSPRGGRWAVHGEGNTRIRSKDSYGNDPLPPRDTEH